MIKQYQEKPLCELTFAIVGLGLIAYPSVSDWWNTLHASRVVNQYDQIVGRTSAQDADQMLQAARDYNDELRGRTDKYAWDEAEEVRYETLVKLIDTCRASDIWNFSLATDGGEGEGAGKCRRSRFSWRP